MILKCGFIINSMNKKGSSRKAISVYQNGILLSYDLVPNMLNVKFTDNDNNKNEIDFDFLHANAKLINKSFFSETLTPYDLED